MPANGHKRPVSINDRGTCDDVVIPESCQYIYRFDEMHSPSMDLVSSYTQVLLSHMKSRRLKDVFLSGCCHGG